MARGRIRPKTAWHGDAHKRGRQHLVQRSSFRPWRWLILLAVLVAAPLGAQERKLAVKPAPPPSEEGQRRIALVIGNSDYRASPLRNPVNDARAMAQALRDAGFDVIVRENAGLQQMDAAVREFGRRLERAHVGLFYFAGHGMQIKGRNYLIPVDANFEHEDEVAYRSLDAGQVLDKMDSAKTRVNLMILDACRNNPFHRSFRARRQGLAEMEAPAGTLIAFATAPGAVALDGKGANGVYTKHLLQRMREPAVPVEQAFKRVRIGVAEETRDAQIPWESSSLREDFQFRPIAATAAHADPTGDAAVEIAFWEAVKESRRSDDFAAYLEQFPNGRFVALARIRQRDLQKPAAPAAAPTAATGVPASFAPAPSHGVAEAVPYLRLAGNGHSAAAFSPDSRSVALAGSDGMLRIHDAATGTEAATRDLGGPLGAVRYSPDGRFLAVGGKNGETTLIDLANGKPAWRKAFGGRPLVALAFSPDARYLLAAAIDGQLWLAALSSGEIVQQQRIEGLPVRDASISPDGRYIAVVQGEDRSSLVRILEIGSARQRLTVAAAAASFSVNGRYLLVALGGHTPTLFDISNAQEIRRFARHTMPIVAGAYAADGRHVAMVDAEGHGQILETREGKTVGNLVVPRTLPRAVAFSGDATRFLLIDADGRAALYRFEVKS